MGIGRALLEGALNGVLEYGAKECYLEVRVSNESAIRLYESFGFGSVTKLRGYYRDGEEALVMCKRF
jgi:ribosomal-protein-alanine N-acetyltransferase